MAAGDNWFRCHGHLSWGAFAISWPQKYQPDAVAIRDHCTNNNGPFRDRSSALAGLSCCIRVNRLGKEADRTIISLMR